MFSVAYPSTPHSRFWIGHQHAAPGKFSMVRTVTSKKPPPHPKHHCLAFEGDALNPRRLLTLRQRIRIVETRALFELPSRLWLGIMDRVNFERRQRIPAFSS